jgi:hypothetical protein
LLQSLAQIFSRYEVILNYQNRPKHVYFLKGQRKSRASSLHSSNCRFSNKKATQALCHVSRQQRWPKFLLLYQKRDLSGGDDSDLTLKRLKVEEVKGSASTATFSATLNRLNSLTVTFVLG